jgi:ribosomal protein L7/L12
MGSMRLAVPVLSLTLLAPALASAAEIPVATVAELAAAIQAAQPGDTLVLADGTYVTDGMTCSAAGTAATPIVVRAQNPLAATIETTGTEGFKVTGPHWHFEGLVVRGTCVDDDTCEHAFHVVGAATGFVLRRSVVEDYNAQLKVNAEQVNGVWTAPDDGLVELCEIRDGHPRATSNPVTKLNIDGGERWVVRDNYLHDFEKAGGNTVSYGAFMKSGGKDGLFERNLVVCTASGATSGVRIGLSFGGGGTAPDFCAPSYDPSGTCDIEHTGGVMRNNIIASCSDVGIYLNRAQDTQLLFNTLVATTGIDFRFDTSSGLAHGNLLQDGIRDRDGATHSDAANMTDVPLSAFQAYYQAPELGDLRILGDVSGLVGLASPHDGVTDDYCARARPGGAGYTFGALEHSLGDCATLPPPGPAETGSGGGGAGPTGSGGAGASSSSGGGSGGEGGTLGQGGSAVPESEDSGCGCRLSGAVGGSGGSAGCALGLSLALLLARRRRAVALAASLVVVASAGCNASSDGASSPVCPVCESCPVASPVEAGVALAGAYRVVMSDTGTRRIEVLEVIRAHTGLGLREAKALVDAVVAGNAVLDKVGQAGAFVVVKEGLALPAATTLRSELGGAGAQALVLREP